LVDILSDIQTPQLHQQVNIFDYRRAFQNHAISGPKNQLRIVFFISINYDYNNNQQTLKKVNRMDPNLPIVAHGRDLLNKSK